MYRPRIPPQRFSPVWKIQEPKKPRIYPVDAVFNNLIVEGLDGFACDEAMLSKSEIRKKFSEIVGRELKDEDSSRGEKTKKKKISNEGVGIEVPNDLLFSRLMNAVIPQAAGKFKILNIEDTIKLELFDRKKLNLAILSEERDVMNSKKIAEMLKMEVDFLEGDVLSCTDIRFRKDSFDYISSFLSLHRYFLTEELADKCIQTISEKLKDGGKFFGVILNADKFKGFIGNKVEDKYGNSIKFLNGKYDHKVFYGQQVEIETDDLKTSVTESPVSIISMKQLFKKCKKAGLVLDYKGGVKDFVQDYTVNYDILSGESILEFFTMFSLTKTTTPTTYSDFEFQKHISAIEQVYAKQEDREKIPSVADVQEFYFEKAVKDLYNNNYFLLQILKKDTTFPGLPLRVRPNELNYAFRKIEQSQLLDAKDREYVSFIGNEFNRIQKLLQAEQGEIRRVIRRRFSGSAGPKKDIKTMRYIEDPYVDRADLLKHRDAIRSVSRKLGNKIPAVDDIINYYYDQELQYYLKSNPRFKKISKISPSDRSSQDEAFYTNTLRDLLATKERMEEDDSEAIERAISLYFSNKPNKPVLKSVYKFSTSRTTRPKKRRSNPMHKKKSKNQRRFSTSKRNKK